MGQGQTVLDRVGTARDATRLAWLYACLGVESHIIAGVKAGLVYYWVVSGR